MRKPGLTAIDVLRIAPAALRAGMPGAAAKLERAAAELREAEAFEERAAIMEFDGELSRAETERLALAADTLPDPARSRATAEQRAELVRLVNLVADHNGFTAEQRQEALDIALADHVAALECFRTLAAGIASTRPDSRSPQAACAGNVG